LLSLTVEQVAGLKPAQVKAFSPTQAAQLTVSQLEAMQRATLQSLAPTRGLQTNIDALVSSLAGNNTLIAPAAASFDPTKFAPEPSIFDRFKKKEESNEQ
jgi:hypothetical protein